MLDEETRAAAAALEAEFSFENLMAEVMEEKKKKEALEYGGMGKDDAGDDDDDRLVLDSNLQFEGE